VDGKGSAAETAEPRRHKVKVDGNEMEVDEQELIRNYQLSKVSYQRLEEAKATKAQVEKFQELLDSDPVKALDQLAKSKGKNIAAYREAMERFLYDQITQEQMSPEQKARLELEQKVRQYEEEKANQAKTAEQAEAQRLQQHYAQEFDKQIGEALVGADLPKTPSTVKRMAKLMQVSLRDNLDLKPADVVKLVREEYLSEQKELIGKLDGEALLKFIGEDTANKIRKYDVARLKAGQKAATRTPDRQPSATPPAQVAPKRNGIGESDWDARIKRIARGEE
jgi:hypothetical protein